MKVQEKFGSPIVRMPPFRLRMPHTRLKVPPCGGLPAQVTGCFTLGASVAAHRGAQAVRGGV